MGSELAVRPEVDGTEVIRFNAYPTDVEVEYRLDSFRPNRVSDSFANAMPKDLTNLVVDDIGSGGGILAIVSAKRNALEVRAVEPADANYQLLVNNIRKNGCEKVVIPYQGVYFDPIKQLPKADMISADVSGIPEIFARALGWYPEGIPTGGPKGSEITCELLRRAPYYIKEEGKLYFPTADDLLNADEILEVARDSFKYVKNAICSSKELDNWNDEKAKSNGKLWKSPDYVWFQLRDEDIQKLDRAYHGNIPPTINIQEVKGRYFWRGKIHVATGPRV
jgi:hypothetical protein